MVSNVTEIGYDSSGSRLHVKFANGGNYVYHDIEPAQHAELLKADSIGSHLHKVIKAKAASVNRMDV